VNALYQIVSAAILCIAVDHKTVLQLIRLTFFKLIIYVQEIVAVANKTKNIIFIITGNLNALIFYCRPDEHAASRQHAALGIMNIFSSTA